MAGLFPFYILREWDNSGKLLSGGLVHFFESGTFTPKAVYTDATYSIEHTNPVQLDAGGAADIFLGDGAYRVLVQTSAGVQVRSPIDGIVGIGIGTFGGPGSNATGVSVKTYSDVRGLATVPDVVYVAGRTYDGDGGAGWFQHIPGLSTVDNDGTMLVTSVGAHAYQRIFDGYIDPLWFGVQYGAGSDQAPALNNALAASALLGFPVLLAGLVTLAQNIIVPAYASITNTNRGWLLSAAPVTVTFTLGSRLLAKHVMFGQPVQPIFPADVAPRLALSWFGGTGDQDRWTKLIASATESYTVDVDLDTQIVLDLTVPPNFALDFAGNKIIVDGLLNIDLGNVVYSGRGQIIEYTSPAYVGSVSIGAPQIFPEWFGAVGDGIADDTIPFHAAAQTGRVHLTGSYLTSAAYSYPNLSLTGPQQPVLGASWDGGSLLVTGNLNVPGVLNVTSARVYAASVACVNGGYLAAFNAYLDQDVGYAGYSFGTSVSTVSTRINNFGVATPVWSKVDTIDGSNTDPVAHVTKLDTGLRRVQYHHAIKHPTNILGPADLAITADDPSLIFLQSAGFQIFTVADPLALSAQKTSYYKIIHAGNVNALFELEGKFRVGATAQTTIKLGGGTGQWCMACELFPNPIYPGEWSVVFAQNF